MIDPFASEFMKGFTVLGSNFLGPVKDKPEPRSVDYYFSTLDQYFNGQDAKK